MNFSFLCNYARFLTDLAPVYSVVEDSFSNDDVRAIILKIEKDAVTLVGINQLVIYRRSIPSTFWRVEMEDDSKPLYLQIKGKELMNYLNAYKNSRRTDVEEVTFTMTERGQIKCTVLEKDKETEKPQTSSYLFDNLPIKRVTELSIGLQGAEESKLVKTPTLNIQLYTKTLLPIMQNGVQLYSYMMFDADNVVAFNNAYTTIMKNTLGKDGVFCDVRLPYKALAFIDRTICLDESTLATKLEQHLYFKSENSEAFVVYDSKITNYQPQVRAYKRDHALVLDRIYLKDTLKRLMLNNESIEFIIQCKTEVVTVKNSKFTQDMRILQTKALDEFDKISFKIMPETLDKSIVGSDSDFSEDVFVYYCVNEDNGKGYIVFADSTSAWYSVVRVNTY